MPESLQALTLIAALALSPSPLAPAQSISTDLRLEDKLPDDKKLPGMEMLVDGSILQKILLPQYDENRYLTSVLRAEKLVLINARTIEGTGVTIRFFHPDRSPKAALHLKTARLTDKKRLQSDEQVTLESEDLAVTGRGLIYDIQNSRGLIRGPATAKIYHTPETPMETSQLRHYRPVGYALMAATALQADPLPKLSPQQVQGLNALAASDAELATTTRNRAEAELQESENLDQKADESLTDFLQDAALTDSRKPMPDLTREVAGPDPANSREPTAIIRANEGIFFDSEAAALVFLDSVSVEHPQFTLSGADELKVFMEPKSPEDGESKAGPAGKFGEPHKIVAVGQVLIERKAGPEGERMVKASGRQLVMDLKTSELIIRGGKPWIISDAASGRVVDPKGYIMINIESGDASFVGKSEGFVELEEKR